MAEKTVKKSVKKEQAKKVHKAEKAEKPLKVEKKAKKETKPVEPETKKPEIKSKMVEKAEKQPEVKRVIKEARPLKIEEKRSVFVIGKRKRAVARGVMKLGSGKVKINNQPLENMQNDIARLMIQEPLLIAGDLWKKYDFSISVRSGGVIGQAEAARQAIARGLIEIFGDPLKKKFLEYDRNLLVYDPRRTEPHKPPHSSWGPRRYKQRSKR
jgi:small subunit ribosomal protein S9